MMHSDLPDVELLLGALNGAPPTGDAAALTTLQNRLVQAAVTDGLLDIAYRRIDSPVGSLLLAATEVGLLRVAFECENHEAVLESLAERVSPRILYAPSRLDAAAAELEDYFAGQRTVFELALDFRLSAGFRRCVLGHLPNISYGTTATYAAVANLAGSPRAVRAVGSACATNPLPVVVPCHRVIRSDGSAGGYVGGGEAKLELLELEGARP